MSKSSHAIYTVGIVFVLLVSAWVAVFHLDRDSIWYDEGFTAFVVFDETKSPDGMRAMVRYVMDSAINVFERARTDVHPLLYYALIDGWTLLMGEAAWLIRLPSVFFGVITLAATFALGRELFDHPTGLMAAVILGMSHFFIYYNREARMYTMLLAITVLLMLATVRWLKHPTVRRGLIMGILMGLLMHTHYVGVFIIISLLLYQVYYFLRDKQFMGLGRWLIPYVTGFLVFLPWLPFAIQQLTGHPDGPLGAVVASTEWGTVTWMWDIMTSSHGGLFFAGFLVGGGLLLIRERHNQHMMILLLLWFIITPLGLLMINSTGRALVVARYMLVSLPPLVIACAFGLRHIATAPSLLSRFNLQPAGVIVSMFVVAWIIVTQLTTYSIYWGDKPRWQQALEQVSEVRQSDEPAIVSFAPHNVATYYARQYPVQKGISIDIGWQDFVPEQLQDFVHRIDSADSVWAILPTDSSKTWYTIPELAAGRTIGYRDSVQNMVMYRFDRTDDATTAMLDLNFYSAGMGRLLSYTGGIGHHYFATSDGDFCFPLNLTAEQDLDANWDLLISLTQGYSTTRAEHAIDLPALLAGQSFDETACIPIPADAPRGPYMLRLAIVHPSGEHQPVVESDADLLWGYFIGVGWVSVDSPTA